MPIDQSSPLGVALGNGHPVTLYGTGAEEGKSEEVGESQVIEYKGSVTDRSAEVPHSAHRHAEQDK